MHTVLLVFEFLGTTELLVIAVVALILFGPRKLPEIGRTVGKGLAEFKRASDDFKRTWEYEVELERRKPALDAAGGAPPEGAADGEPPSYAGATVARGPSDEEPPGGGAGDFTADDPWRDAEGPAEETPAPRAEEDEINAS